MIEQAKRRAIRYTRNGIINEYGYNSNKDLQILKFPEMTEECLDFIIECRSGKVHDYDIVEGSMANDTIFNYKKVCPLFTSVPFLLPRKLHNRTTPFFML